MSQPSKTFHYKHKFCARKLTQIVAIMDWCILIKKN